MGEAVFAAIALFFVLLQLDRINTQLIDCFKELRRIANALERREK